jgi:protein SCO1/2
MIARRILPASAIWLLSVVQATAADRHTVQGILLQVDPAKQSILVSCDPIPGYMEAMEMPFKIRESAIVKTLHPGTTVRFTMIEQNHETYAENLQTVSVANNESEPTEAARLTFLHRALDANSAAKIVPIGQPIPDFILTDQAQQVTHLSRFRGKVVALTFAYSRCPNPNYCFRLSNNLSQVSRRFRERTGRDLVLVTIVIDPDHDQGKALAQYADTWKADPAAWHFLTGPLANIKEIAASFGMNFWNDEGFLIHSFHTVVIDRQGRLAANLEGNQFTAQQLGDLVETVLKRKTSEFAAGQ